MAFTAFGIGLMTVRTLPYRRVLTTMLRQLTDLERIGTWHPLGRVTGGTLTRA